MRRTVGILAVMIGVVVGARVRADVVGTLRYVGEAPGVKPLGIPASEAPWVLPEQGPDARAVLKGHRDIVWSVAFSPDGKTLASGSADHTVRLWSVATTKEITSIKAHPHSVRFSPDGKTLASGSCDRTVRLWDVPSGRNTATLSRHAAVVDSVAFSPDGRTVASGGWGKTIRLWDVATGKNIAILQGHTEPVHSVAFSPDGKTLASGSYDKTIRLWDVPPVKPARR